MIHAGSVCLADETALHPYIEECGITCELDTPHARSTVLPGFLQLLDHPDGVCEPCVFQPPPVCLGWYVHGLKDSLDMAETSSSSVQSCSINRMPTTGCRSRYCTRHDCHPRRIECTPDTDGGTIIDDYDPLSIECDGSFPSHEGECRGAAESNDVIIEKRVGKGRIIVTSVHEFPSRKFLKNFCSTGKETVF